VRNYFYSFYCAVVASIVNGFLSDSVRLTSRLPSNSWVWTELIFFALLGVLGGVLGALFVSAFGNVVLWRRWLVARAEDGKGSPWKRILYILSHPYTYGVAVALYTGLLTFPGNFRFMSLGLSNALRDLSHVGPLSDFGEYANDWLKMPFYLSLTFFVFSRFTGCVLAATMPISSGVFGPCLVIGMGIGRAVGEFVQTCYPYGLAYFSSDLAPSIIPATYAIAGAAALASGVTHTLSTAIIMLEISGQLNLVAPILVSVSCAVATARVLSDSFYDRMAFVRNLPYLPDLDASVYEVKAAEIMQTDVPFVLRHATPQEVASLLSKNKDYNVFPVVQNRETMTLNGYAERRDLTNYLLECFQIVYNTIHEKDSLLESNAGRRALAKSMAFAAWEDTQQQQGGRGPAPPCLMALLASSKVKQVWWIRRS